MALNANDARKDDNAIGDDDTKGVTSLNWKGTKEIKLIVSKTKAKTDSTAFLIDVVQDGNLL